MTVSILITVAVLALAIGLFAFRAIPGIRAYFTYKGKRLITCPETHQPEAVDVAAGEAAVGAFLAEPTIHLKECSRWPERQNCGQECLSQIEIGPANCLVWNIVSHWYEERNCALCHKPIGRLHHLDHAPASDSTMRGWNGITYRVTGKPRAMQIDLQEPLQIDSVLQDGRKVGSAAMATRTSSRSADSEGHDAHGHRVLQRQAAGRTASSLGRRTHLGSRLRTGRIGSRPPARDSARASGGPPRTRRPRSRTASASRSPSPARCRPSQTGACAASSGPGWLGHVRVVRHQPDQQLRRCRFRRPLRAVHRFLRG